MTILDVSTEWRAVVSCGGRQGIPDRPQVEQVAEHRPASSVGCNPTLPATTGTTTTDDTREALRTPTVNPSAGVSGLYGRYDLNCFMILVLSQISAAKECS